MNEKRRSEYFEKLRDPRWQRKRLEIMQRDEFVCIACGDGESTLNVHHRFYVKDNEPWDYPEWSLVTLCESCHKEETESLREEKALLIQAMSMCGAASGDFHDIACSLAHHFENGFDERFWSALSWIIRCKPYELIDAYFESLAEQSKRHRESSTKSEAPCTEP